MTISDRMIEAAEERVLLLSEATVAAISRGLADAGASACTECGEPIEPARRAALPSARRCVHCQRRHELTLEGGGRRA